jgi:actin related protein 2/3 complex subunit 1A/1B
VHFADLTTTQANADPVVHTVRLPQLPLCSLLFLSEQALCGAGHDFNPIIFTGNAGELLPRFISLPFALGWPNSG